MMLDVAGDVAASSVGTSITFSFVANLLMGTSVSQMLGSIKAL